jgi:hypothetical protein
MVRTSVPCSSRCTAKVCRLRISSFGKTTTGPARKGCRVVPQLAPATSHQPAKSGLWSAQIGVVKAPSQSQSAEPDRLRLLIGLRWFRSSTLARIFKALYQFGCLRPKLRERVLPRHRSS